MFKPAKCAITGNETRVCKICKEHWEFLSQKTYGFYVQYIRARTRIGAILRWNWRQWRARRKKKGR